MSRKGMREESEGKGLKVNVTAINEHGLVGHAIWDVVRATQESQLQYASAAWSVFLMRCSHHPITDGPADKGRGYYNT